MKHNKAVCEHFQHAIELVGSRWTGAVIFVLLDGTSRFAQLRDAIPGVTDRMLAERLRELEAEGIIDRSVIPDTPVRVEYALTEKGRALAGAINAVGKWAKTWVAEPAVERPAPARPRTRTSAR